MVNALEGHPAEDHARFCFSKLRFLSVTLKDDLRRRGLWEDLAQEIYRISLEGWRDGKTAREMGGIATRELRAFFRAYGYVRNQRDHAVPFGGRVDGLIKPERTLSTFGTYGDEPEDLWEGVLSLAEPVPTPYEAPRGLEEAILALLREHPEGVSQCQANTALGRHTSAAVVADCCARLVVRGLVREVARPKGPGRPPSPLLYAANQRQKGGESDMKYTTTATKAQLVDRLNQALCLEHQLSPLQFRMVRVDELQAIVERVEEVRSQ